MKLPPELETDILSRLPVKSLLRFRCVSKEWLRLLTTDTHFINNMHLPRSLKANSTNPNPSLISLSKSEVGGTGNCYLADYKVTESEEGGEVLKGVVKPVYVDLQVDDENNKSSWDYYYRCGGICNGLVCISQYKYTINYESVTFRLFIWNPLTRNHITLTSLPLPPPPHHSDAFVVFGFGFHPPTNQYKVVRVLTSYDEPQSISVYTLGTKTWRPIGDASYDFGFRNFPVTINGAPHWAVGGFRTNYHLIVTFDVKDEVFQETSLPFPTDNRGVRITDFGGLVCVIVYSTLQQDIEMWVMKEYGVASSWTKLFKVRKFQIPTEAWNSSLYDWIPTGISDNGDITFRSNSDHREMKLLIYKPKTNSIKGPTKFGISSNCVFIFAGSLISPKVINGGAQEVTLTEEIQSQC